MIKTFSVEEPLTKLKNLHLPNFFTINITFVSENQSITFSVLSEKINRKELIITYEL